MTHSGNLASSSSSWRAFLKQRNAITVGNLDELIEAVVVASADQRGDVHPHRRAACLMSVSGGDCTLLADLAERTGWDLPDLSEEGHAQLIKVVGKQTLADNPLDVGGLWRKGLVPEVASIVAAHSPAEVVAFRLNLPDEPEPELLDAYRVLARSARDAGQFPVALTRASERIGDHWYTFFSDLDVPLLHEYEQALTALGRIADYHQSRAGRLEAARRETQAPPRNRPADVVAWFKALPPGPLSFSRCMELLEVYDIPLVHSVVVATEAEATAAADDLGYPVVVKADSQEVSHRSEIGAVRINLENREAVASAYRDVLRNVNAVADLAVTSRVIVQAQLPPGVELLVGSTLDPELGQVLSMGLGGVFVEIFRDIAQRVTPLSSLDFSEMLADLRGRPLLEGARGTAVSDVAALERLVASVSRLSTDLGEDLSELDLNPVIVLPDGRGAWAVDVLIVRSGSGAIAASQPDLKLTKAVAQ
jgi:acetyltransferase